ncbi:hypothetical protein [Sinorhizobium saheli]|uniref:Uncharacterized protein n=1 Tax=Sinorhizobium saheli TaxID=36856 RepID=A0A178YSB2_SINSA|nr:hypothetical protein [Sinorhizobium saheli]MQW86425.1 hypothetical protein [Sinorhizobium saheli]OAP50500.1 hypothetical protein ATB98_14970 [Sinorhizobium saheli]
MFGHCPALIVIGLLASGRASTLVTAIIGLTVAIAETTAAWKTGRLAILAVMSMAEPLSGSGIAAQLGPESPCLWKGNRGRHVACFGRFEALANSGNAANGLFMSFQVSP